MMSRIERAGNEMTGPGEEGRGLSNAFSYSLALAFFLAFCESVLPHPVPFLRYGFANISLLMAAKVLRAGEFFLLVAGKALLSSLFSANFLTALFPVSLVCNIAAFSLVFALRRQSAVSFIGLSAVSSFAFNSLQSLFLARFVLGFSAARPLAIMILFGNLMGFFTGAMANVLFPVFCANAGKEIAVPETLAANGADGGMAFFVKPGQIATMAFTLAFVFIFNLLVPSGKVIAKFAFIRITAGALRHAVVRTGSMSIGYALGLAIRSRLRLKGHGVFSRMIALYGIFVSNFLKAREADGKRTGLMERIRESICI